MTSRRFLTRVFSSAVVFDMHGFGLPPSPLSRGKRSGSDEAKVVGSSNAVADEHMKVRCEFRGAGVNAGSYVLAWRRHGSELWHDGWFMVE